MMDRLIFRIEKLTFSYTDMPVFEDFSAISNAKVVVLRGPSGCGKTTLLKLLTGHLKPTSSPIYASIESSCLVIQEDGLFPWLTGVQNLTIGGNISYETVCQHPMYFLIKDFVEKKTYTLSFGQRRKIELVRAFTRRFRMLCLDEPFNFIDPGTRTVLADYINSNAMPETLIVMTTHYDADVKGIESDIFTFDVALPVHGKHTPVHHKSGNSFL